MRESAAVIAPPATLAVLGGGQLGRFFVRAAQELGYRVWVLDPDPQAPAGQIAERHLVAPYHDQQALALIAAHAAAATTEFENVPAAALEQLAAHIAVRPSAQAVAVCQDRRSEKAFLTRHNLPCGPYRVIESVADCCSVDPALSSCHSQDGATRVRWQRAGAGGSTRSAPTSLARSWVGSSGSRASA